VSLRIPHPIRPTLALFGAAVAVRFLLGCGEGPAVASTASAKSAAPKEAPSAAHADATASATTAAVASGSATPRGAEGAAPDGSPMVTLSAVGDCTLGDPAGSELAPGSFHDVFDTHGKDMARPFAGVVSVLREDDLTIANLETTLGTEPQRRDVPFAFRGRPEFAEMLVAGSVEVVNVANNHSNDCGPKGVKGTLAALDAAHVAYFGLGHVDVRTIHGIEVVNLGYTGGREEVLDQVVKDVKAHKRPDNLVIVTFHWGIEGEHASNSVQIHLGHGSIDAGADLVLGHHPHVLQGLETYKGKKIVYSLGNFVFGGNARPAELDSMIYRARFVSRGGKIEPLDDRIIPVSISANHVQNDFAPVLLEGAEADRVSKAVAGYSKAFTK
jgi:poly-gamma-glutamate synthesis protein (capsule biosynthesis protein)